MDAEIIRIVSAIVVDSALATQAVGSRPTDFVSGKRNMHDAVSVRVRSYGAYCDLSEEQTEQLISKAIGAADALWDLGSCWF